MNSRDTWMNKKTMTKDIDYRAKVVDWRKESTRSPNKMSNLKATGRSRFAKQPKPACSAPYYDTMHFASCGHAPRKKFGVGFKSEPTPKGHRSLRR